MNGKGSKPRNCFSKEFKNNYDAINWSKNETKIKRKEDSGIQRSTPRGGQAE